MAKTDAWMPLYVGDYLADTMHLNAVQHGAYLLLIMHYWRTGPLPDNDGDLAAIARTERKVWREIAPVIRRFFQVDGGYMHHKRIDQEREKAAINSSKRRDAANARWKPNRSTSNANASSNDDAKASDLHDVCISNAYDLARVPPSPSDSERKNPPVGPREAGTRTSGSNPRATGSNPRATGDSPRDLGTNPRANGTNPRSTNPVSRGSRNAFDDILREELADGSADTEYRGAQLVPFVGRTIVG
jgi:uncharacterized protein YdaU (DUF1376 family)